MEFNGKVAFVTGGGSGIGAATALMLASRGATVMVFEKSSKKAAEIEEKLRHISTSCKAIVGDVSRSDELFNAITSVYEQTSRLDIAVNNAAIPGDGLPITQLGEDGWRSLMAINLDGVFFGMKHQISTMNQLGRGSIINVSSILGCVGYMNAAAYTSSKHGVIGLTRAAAVECGSKNIRVNAVCPGFIRTPMLDGIPAENMKAISQLHALQRIGEPEEVAELICFLASDASSFVTGACLPVDGGYLAT